MHIHRVVSSVILLLWSWASLTMAAPVTSNAEQSPVAIEIEPREPKIAAWYDNAEAFDDESETQHPEQEYEE